MRALIIAGPTAAGKSATAMQLAKEFDAVILSADAMQVYRGMDIGTASPTAEEQKDVTHYGINCINPDERFSAAAFMRLGHEVLQRHERVIVVGGTSMYLRALVRGLVPTPDVDPDLRSRLERADDLHAQLVQLDPPLASRLHPNDRLRLIRGIEVALAGGPTLSELQAEHAARPDLVSYEGVWIDRTDLYERIDSRVLTMMSSGYLEEVRTLLDRGYGPDLKSMQTLGYRHLCEHLLQGLPIDEAIRRTQRDTRHFSRKQRNWRKQLGLVDAGDTPILAARHAATRLFLTHSMPKSNNTDT